MKRRAQLPPLGTNSFSRLTDRTLGRVQPVGMVSG
jgi:hypothetical protein